MRYATNDGGIDDDVIIPQGIQVISDNLAKQINSTICRDIPTTIIPISIFTKVIFYIDLLINSSFYKNKSENFKKKFLNAFI